MTEAVQVALITGGFSVLAVIVTNVMANNKMQTQIEKSLAVYQVKLEDLTKKVEKHNSVVERTFKLEQTAALHEEKIKVANHRLDDLESK